MNLQVKWQGMALINILTAQKLDQYLTQRPQIYSSGGKVSRAAHCYFCFACTKLWFGTSPLYTLTFREATRSGERHLPRASRKHSSHLFLFQALKQRETSPGFPISPTAAQAPSQKINNFSLQPTAWGFQSNTAFSAQLFTPQKKRFNVSKY